MSERKVFGANERRWGVPVAAAAAAGALLLTACGGGGGVRAEGDASVSSSAAAPEKSSSNQGSEKAIEFTFDDLGASYPTIQVYPGTTENAADRKPNGTYKDGESFVADCKTEGRMVNSDVASGEPDVSSDQWVRFQGVETSYATAVYIEDRQEVLEALPEC
jgi:hypothetical protein